MSTLRLTNNTIVFSDPSTTTAPRLRHVDWLRSLTVDGVSNPRSESYTLAPSEERVVFNGTRTLAVDGTTVFSIALVPSETVEYRLRHTSGTAPGFRTARSFAANGGTVAVVVNDNQTITFTIAGGVFTNIIATDILWLPGTEESVTSPFSILNQGFWKVMTASATVMVCQRLTSDFDGASESGIAITNANQMAAFSATGVQAGDKVELISGFAAANRSTYPVLNVTSAYIDFQSVVSLAAETGVTPTAAGLAVYSNAKRWVRVEVDQESAVKVNGDTSTTQKVAPWVAGDVNGTGEYVRSGPTFSLSVLNLSLVSATLTVVSVE
jgi:hypothetical protein